LDTVITEVARMLDSVQGGKTKERVGSLERSFAQTLSQRGNPLDDREVKDRSLALAVLDVWED
jgi:hypothetical protein